MKRLFTLIIVCILFCNMLMLTAVAETEESRFGEITRILESLSIYLPDDAMELERDSLTREDMARILSVFVEGERFSEIRDNNISSYYSDVPDSHKSAYEIMLLAGSGIMSGYSDRTFRPEANVRFIEALKTFVSVLGYDIAAQEKGGWPDGYKSMAVKLGLNKGISLTDTASMTKGDFTKLLWNALNTEVLSVDSLNSGGGFEAKQGNILLNTMNIYELKGVLIATDRTALFGYDNCEEHYVRIGNTLVYSDKGYEYLLGRNVKAYYEHTKEGEAVLRYISDDAARNDIVVVSANDISDSTTTSRFVYSDNGKKKHFDIKSNTSVIFNGIRLTYFGLEHLMPKTGTVTLIDAGNGNDTVYIESYLDYYVSSIYNDGVVLKIAENNGKAPVTLELKNIDENVVVKKGNEILSTDVLKRDMLISVASDKMESDGNGALVISEKSEIYNILVGGKTIVGTISMIDSEKALLTVNGVDYKCSKALNFETLDNSLGKSVVISLNPFGEIAKIRPLTIGTTLTYVDENLDTKTAQYSDDECYGFVIEAGRGSGLDRKNLYLKIYTQGGEFVEVIATERTDLDGKRYKNSFPNSFLESLQKARDEFKSQTKFEVSNGSGYEQLIRYTMTTDGTVRSIDTIMPDSEENSLDFDMKITTSGVIFPGQEETIAVKGIRADGTINCSGGPRDIEGIAGVAKNVVSFSIPYDLEQEKGYSIIDVFQIKTTKSPLLLFDMDDFNMAKAIMVQGVASSGEFNYKNDSIMLVEEKLMSRDDEDNFVETLVGYDIISGKSVMVQLDETIKEKFDIIEEGDIVGWVFNNYGKANLINLVCTSDYENAETLTLSSPTTDYGQVCRLLFGTVQNIRDDRLLLKYDGGILSETCTLESVKMVFCVDSENKEVKKGDLSMIKSVADYGEGAANKVFLYQDYGKPVTVIIFN